MFAICIVVAITKGSWSIDLSQGTELSFCKTDYLEPGPGQKTSTIGPLYTTSPRHWPGKPGLKLEKILYFCEMLGV